MKTCTKCGETKPLTDYWKKPNGNLRPTCQQCMKAENKAWVAKNPDKVIAAKRKWDAKNPEAKAAYARAKYAANSEMRERIGAWRKANPDKVSAYTKTWNDANKGLKASYTAKRRAATIRATPLWVDQEKIIAIYEEAAAMRELGIDVHVDHVIPLQGKLVSGLHVHTNLQLLLATDNILKRNDFPVSV